MPAMPRTTRYLAALLVVALSMGIAAVVVLQPGPPPTPGPLESGSATTSPAASATVSPTAVASGADLQAFAQIESQVRALRELPAPDIGSPEVITRDQLGAEVDNILDETWTAEELRRANLMLTAMGLLQPGQDLRALTAELLSGQVLGFYDPARQRMVVVSDSGLSPGARVTYAHEYTHALQDAAFDTFDALDQLVDDDAIGAIQALEEGDATVVMFQWAFANLRPDELAQIGETPLPDTSGIPNWMVRQLEWPYVAGFGFVNALTGGQGWDSVDAAYADPPTSTEQIIHPEKYLDREPPIEVDAPAVAEALGSGWQELEPNTVGEALIDIWLGELGSTSSPAVAAAGWGGDRLAVAEGPDGEWAMAWRVAWDSAADADEFVAAYRATAAPDGFANSVSRSSPTETLVLHASSATILGQLRDGLGR